ncbi:hypothetical protein Cni_G23334 [Canna indica]|uniref:Uncharacterized protein n=1 Tax=Canna indica TaxID=4628 RepID=A0AAQ3KTU3_9LILI|nr:hypothetical protein Cni_G23334 [Canna indica]
MEVTCVRGCPWRIYDNLMQNETTFIIKTFVDEHKCCRSMENRQATVEWLANYYMKSFRRNSDWGVKHMTLDFQSKFFISLPRAKCYRVRTAALERLGGSVEEHYALLGSYLAELLKGLDHTLHERVPHVEHRNCARHLYANWKKRYNGHYYKSLFLSVVRSMEELDLSRTLSELEVTSPQAHDAFIAIGMNKFCQAYVGTTCKSDNVTNNTSEIFNSYILNARSKSIVDMLEDIRRMLMQRMYVKKEMMLKFMDEICPNIRKKLEKFKEESRFCTVTPSGNLKFEVQYLDKVHVVNLAIQSCSCRSWDLSEQLRGKEAWPNVDGPPVLPPKVKKMSGRPKKVRRREMHEDNRQSTKYTRSGAKMTCKLCLQQGHNRRSCTLMAQLTSTHDDESQAGPSTGPSTSRGRGRGRGRSSSTTGPSVEVEVEEVYCL